MIGVLRVLPLALGLVVTAGQANAETLHLVLDARNTQVSILSNSLLGAIPARFTAVAGALDYNPAEQTCTVHFSMPVSSLVLPTLTIRSLVMSESFLDAAAFPTISVDGACQPTVIDGKALPELAANVTMRGQTRPATFAVRYRFQGRLLVGITSDGRIDRRLWGVGGLLGTVEPMIRIDASIALGDGPPPS